MITTTNARIEVGASNHTAWADIGRACSGFVGVVKFTPSFGGGFFLAHRIEDPKYKALIIAPESKWAGDVVNEGWIIEHEITDDGIQSLIDDLRAALDRLEQLALTEKDGLLIERIQKTIAKATKEEQ